MLTQELGTVDFNEEFIILMGEIALIAEKALYYLDPYFIDRLMKVITKLESLTMELNKTKKIFGLNGLKYPSKE